MNHNLTNVVMDKCFIIASHFSRFCHTVKHSVHGPHFMCQNILYTKLYSFKISLWFNTYKKDEKVSLFFRVQNCELIKRIKYES